MSSPKKTYDMIFKLIVIGDSGVGKSCMLRVLKGDDFNEDSKPTVGVEFCSKNYYLDDHEIKVQIWDTAGQERYFTITSSYYKGAKGCALVYDIANKETFNNVGKWMQQSRDNGDEGLITILIGNKNDLGDSGVRQVEIEEGKKFAEENKMMFMETSAKENINIEKAFQILVEKVYKSNKQIFEKDITLNFGEDKDNEKENEKVNEKKNIKVRKGKKIPEKEPNLCCW